MNFILCYSGFMDYHLKICPKKASPIMHVTNAKNNFLTLRIYTKGQIKPKGDWRALDSPKKRTKNLFCLTSCFTKANKTNSFDHFLGESTERLNCLWFYLTFMDEHNKNMSKISWNCQIQSSNTTLGLWKPFSLQKRLFFGFYLTIGFSFYQNRIRITILARDLSA